MNIFNQGDVTIFFGAVDSSIEPSIIKKQRLTARQFAACKSFSAVSFLSEMPIVMLHQVHGTRGVILTSKDQLSAPFMAEGDFLCTNQSRIALAVTTADCLPLILVCQEPLVISIVHAGWRGTVKGIVQQVVKILTDTYAVKPENMQASIGPYAQACCYEVGQEVVDQVTIYPASYHASLLTSGDKLFFDGGFFNKRVLLDMGVRSENIFFKGSCTICDERYCSYRRNKTTRRQVSLVCINRS